MVQDVKDALGAGRRLLRDGDDAAHGIQTAIKPPDIGNEGREHTHRDLVARHQPDAEGPHHQQPDFGEQRHRGREQAPGLVELVVHFQVVLVGVAKALGLALFLGKSLHHADAGDGVGQHIGHFGPHAVDLFKAGAQTVTHGVDHPGNERQRHQGDQRQPGVDGEQNHRSHEDHEHVGDEIERVQRQEDVDPVGFRPDARHQVARALAAKVIERQAQQVLIGGGAQVSTDALGHQRQDVSARPRQAPGGQSRQKQPTQVRQYQPGVNGLPVLVRDQDVVHQRDGEVRGHQRGGRGRHGESKACRQLLAVGAGKPPQAQQHPGGGLGRLGAGAGRAFVRIRRQGGMASGTRGLVFLCGSLTRPTLDLLLKALHQAQRLGMVAEGKAPKSHPLLRVVQLQRSHAPVVLQLECQAGCQGPVPPYRGARVARQQAPGSHHHPTADEAQICTQVNL